MFCYYYLIQNIYWNNVMFNGVVLRCRQLLLDWCEPQQSAETGLVVYTTQYQSFFKQQTSVHPDSVMKADGCNLNPNQTPSLRIPDREPLWFKRLWNWQVSTEPLNETRKWRNFFPDISSFWSMAFHPVPLLSADVWNQRLDVRSHGLLC